MSFELDLVSQLEQNISSYEVTSHHTRQNISSYLPITHHIQASPSLISASHMLHTCFIVFECGADRRSILAQAITEPIWGDLFPHPLRPERGPGYPYLDSRLILFSQRDKQRGLPGACIGTAPPIGRASLGVARSVKRQAVSVQAPGIYQPLRVIRCPSNPPLRVNPAVAITSADLRHPIYPALAINSDDLRHPICFAESFSHDDLYLLHLARQDFFLDCVFVCLLVCLLACLFAC